MKNTEKAENTDIFSPLLQKYSIADSDILFRARCDMKNAEEYTKALLLLCKSEIVYIDEGGQLRRTRLCDIQKIYTESFVSSGRIIVQTIDGESCFAFFGAEYAKEIDRFVAAADRYISSKDEKLPKDVRYADSAEANVGRKKLFLRVLSYVPKYKASLAAMIAIIVFSTIINIVTPYISGTVLYDQVLTKGGKYYGKIWGVAAFLVSISALTVFLGIVQGRIGADMSGRVIYDIKTEVFSAMQNLGMSFFSSKKTGNLLNRVNSDALDIQYFLNDGLPNFIINALTIASIGLVLFIKNPILSVTVLIPVPVMALIIKKASRNFKKLKWHTWRRSSAMNSIINDTLLGIRVVKAFGREERENARFFESAQELYKNRLREGYAQARVFPFLGWIMSMGAVFVWAIGGVQVLGGRLSFGRLMTFVGYLAMLYNPVNSMVRVFDWWSSCMNSAQRIFEVTDARPDVTESENAVHIERIRGDIEFKNVTFAYEPNKNVLKNVSFDVKSGEMIGLVGRSGAGKSTITNLLARLYDVNDGEITIDGTDVKEIKKEDLHKNIGIVLQETFLFSGSIAENISYAKPNATMEEIIYAAKKAYAHEFIVRLPDGYETQLGKNGVSLSGGEKQRIGIARAILMNPSILILDEATSSLDTKTEKKIQQALEQLIRGRTTIAIAHRLSTLKNADRLVVIENGRVAETGTHKELFSKKDGVYARMAKTQLEALRLSLEDGGFTENA